MTFGDGRRLALLRRALARLAARYTDRLGHSHPRLDDLRLLLDRFPGLVVPLELREERGRFERRSAIADMLRFVRDVARGGLVDWYVRGCVVSMTKRAEDLWEAHALVRDVLGASTIPVVPLFEMPDVLPVASDILERVLTNTDFAKAVREQHGSLEVMLGYSDTSKRMGVLVSRLAIQEAMSAIAAWGAAHEIKILFFHGSGGSVGRGGGSIADQAACWPSGATAVVKQTLQGEMVERTLATPEIFRSQVLQIARGPGLAAPILCHECGGTESSRQEPDRLRRAGQLNRVHESAPCRDPLHPAGHVEHREPPREARDRHGSGRA